VILRRSFIAVLVLAPVALLVYSLVSYAGPDDETIVASGVPEPVIPRGQGDSCVEDTDFMRRNHMTLLRQQRDETVHKGIRSKRHSLKECVACHAVPGPDGMPLTVASPKHFCRSCHDYAAVKIDCFQCHASRPDQEPAPGEHGGVVAAAE
jgi:[DsrC]-trisulfide reductase subunit J